MPDMSLAYFITAHKQPQQVGRLVRAIQRTGDVALVHYDLKASAAERKEVAEVVGRSPGARLAEKPRRVDWATWSLVRVELDAIRELLANDRAWTHFIPLSGQCFPLARPEAIACHCERNEGTSLMDVF